MCIKREKNVITTSIYIYISIRVQGLLSQCKNNVSKIKREKKKKIQKVLMTSLINKNTPPKYITTLISKTTPPFCHEWQRVSHWEAIISSSTKELAPSSSSSSSLLEPSSSLSSFEACGDGDEEAVKPPMTAYRHAIRPTWVFNWHNLSLRVSMRESMHTSCATMALRVTSPTKEEGVDVDGAKEAGGATVSVCGCFGWS